jgi:hypothetical protein
MKYIITVLSLSYLPSKAANEPKTAHIKINYQEGISVKNTTMHIHNQSTTETKLVIKWLALMLYIQVLGSVPTMKASYPDSRFL